MNTDTTPVTVDTPYGKLYVFVMMAREDSFTDMERGHVTEYRPRIRVASDPDFKGLSSSDDHWTIRGRAYGIDAVMYFQDRSGSEYATGTVSDFWHRDTRSYDHGYRNDRGTVVDWHTKTYDLINSAVYDACAQFATENTGWNDLSEYLHWSYNRQREQREADRLRAEASEHEAKAREFWKKSVPVFDSLPEYLKDRIR